jgi:arylformamidase
MFVDLSHVITDGMQTYPGLPALHIVDHLSRAAAEEIYGEGITFQIGLITMCTNTGTYLDVRFHRYADGHDLGELALEHAVQIRTDHSRRWAT